jgi:TIR domain
MTDDLTSVYQDLAGYVKAKAGQCVLVLGPELCVDQEGTGYRPYFRRLATDKNMGIYKYFQEENLFAFNDEAGFRNTRRKVKDFYRDCGDEVLLEMIARIKFPLIINVCPDFALNKVYERLNIKFEAVYFSKDAKPNFQSLPKPSKEIPVIYNIFGAIEPDNSLILDHNKLYETIQHLLPDNSMPEKIETYLNEVSGFLLLGLKFDSWYYQLLCHKLKLKANDKINLSSSNVNSSSSVSIAVHKHFSIDFAADNPVQAISKLIAECGNSPEALREIPGTGSYSLFVSYAWKDEAPDDITRETVVDWLEKDSGIKDTGTLLFLRDRSHLGFGDSIDSFMTRIGKGKLVIRVISDKYLKSRYCMTEAIRIDRYRDDEQRIFTILWEDADLDNEKAYRDYWRNKSQVILEDPDNTNFDDAVQIYRFLPSFFKRLKDEVNLRVGKNDFKIDAGSEKIDVDAARQQDFTAFTDTIISKLKAS